MPLSSEERAELLRRMPDLSAGASREALASWAAERRQRVLDELGDRPGHDQVRAAAIRLVPDLVEAHLVEETLSAAAAALSAFEGDVREGDPHVLLVRHPAWAGLCAIELGAARGRALEALPEALRLARLGFSAMGRIEAGDGELLWAMAEQADEAGWAPRASALLATASTARFADPEAAVQVRLLRALHLAEQESPDAIDALVAVAADAAAPSRARVHAAWVLGHLLPGGAGSEWLRAALAWVDEDEDPEVVERLRAAIEGRG